MSIHKFSTKKLNLYFNKTEKKKYGGEENFYNVGEGNQK